jgi:hypothetical protein
MPKRRSKKKSEAIRRVLGEYPQASVKDIVSFLGREGVKVRPSMVYYLRSRLRRKTRRATRKAAADGAARTYSAELILGVKNLAKEAGGYNNLKQLVEVLGG